MVASKLVGGRWWHWVGTPKVVGGRWWHQVVASKVVGCRWWHWVGTPKATTVRWWHQVVPQGLSLPHNPVFRAQFWTRVSLGSPSSCNTAPGLSCVSVTQSKHKSIRLVMFPPPLLFSQPP